MTDTLSLQLEAGPSRRESLCRVVRELGAQGWCQGTGGNFSVTLSRDPLRLLITRSGVDKRRLGAGDLLLVGPGGAAAPEASDPASARPSAEAALHCRIVSRTGAGAVLHVHSVAGTLLGEHFAGRGGFTLSGYEMQKGLAGVASHLEEVFVPVLANSQDMALLSGEIELLLDRRPGLHGLLLAGHGLYAWGETLEQARRHVEIFEFLFECVARRTPFEPFSGG